MSPLKRSPIGSEAAIALGTTGWWKTKTPREIALFQLVSENLCCPFDVFHEAIEKALGRSVWTHEFGTNWDGLLREIAGEEPMPSFDQIMDLIPASKRVLVAVGKKDS